VDFGPVVLGFDPLSLLAIFILLRGFNDIILAQWR
jgi:hypothetical protein